jgi:hypothetical protein
MKHFSIYISIFSAILFSGFFFSSDTRAAVLIFETSSTVFSIGRDVKVDIVVDSEGQGLNAFEGRVSFPNSLLSLKQIHDGNSIISFWIERPRLSSADSDASTIAWSGITPGGFHEVPGFSAEKRGNLFSIIFSPRKEGTGRIEADNIRILLEDGQGTPAKVSSLPLFFKTKEGAGTVTPIAEDTNRPEEFRPQIANDPLIFDNQNFLAFAASDKESGIDHYEVLETWFNRIPENAGWINAESPYLLKNQALDTYIFVKAVDKSGNYLIESVPPLHPEVRYKYYLLLGTIILAILAVGSLLWKKLKRK